METCHQRDDNPNNSDPNNPNNPNNFSYEKVSVSYDVVRAVFAHSKFLVAHPHRHPTRTPRPQISSASSSLKPSAAKRKNRIRMPYVSKSPAVRGPGGPAQTGPRPTPPAFRIRTGNDIGVPRELHGLYAGVSRERCKPCPTRHRQLRNPQGPLVRQIGTMRIMQTTLATKKSALATMLFALFSPIPTPSSPATGRHLFVAGPATALAELADISATKHTSPATNNLPLDPTTLPSLPRTTRHSLPPFPQPAAIQTLETLLTQSRQGCTVDIGPVRSGPM